MKKTSDQRCAHDIYLRRADRGDLHAHQNALSRMTKAENEHVLVVDVMSLNQVTPFIAMMATRAIVCLCFKLVVSTITCGQTYFRDDYERLDPVMESARMEHAERVHLHDEFLSRAIAAKDTKLILLGNLYLLSDHMVNQDYVNAKARLITVDSLADLVGDKQWQGHVAHRKAILNLKLEKLEEARAEFEASIALCEAAGDSLCVAEGLEEIGYILGYQGDLEKARQYHTEAIRFFYKCGAKEQVATALNNIAIVSVRHGQSHEGIANYRQAIALYKELSMDKEMSSAMNNLADAYRNQQEYGAALDLLEECISLNRKNGYFDNLRFNYANISAVYDSLGDYKTSKLYLGKYFALKDSLIGAGTQTRIAELGFEHQAKQKELVLARSENELQASRSRSRIKSLVILCLILGFLLLFALTYQRIKRALMDLKSSKEEVRSLSNENRSQNEKITELEATLREFRSKIHLGGSGTQRAASNGRTISILTEEDWIAFKNYIQNAHPGYIGRLRMAYPEMTTAEERLFLLVKENHTTKEIAHILGISEDSVKKTRVRLRKRLSISKEVGLERFVAEF